MLVISVDHEEGDDDYQDRHGDCGLRWGVRENEDGEATNSGA